MNSYSYDCTIIFSSSISSAISSTKVGPGEKILARSSSSETRSKRGLEGLGGVTVNGEEIEGVLLTDCKDIDEAVNEPLV